MNVNLKVPDDLNQERKKLGVTWRELITLGLTTLQGNPTLTSQETPGSIQKKVDPEIGVHLKQALQAITEACRLIQKESSE